MVAKEQQPPVGDERPQPPDFCGDHVCLCVMYVCDVCVMCDVFDVCVIDVCEGEGEGEGEDECSLRLLVFL